MPGRPSAIGFGFQAFGDHPFGSADWAEETTYKILPTHNRDDDAKCVVDPLEPLRKFINAFKPQIQEIRDKYEIFPDLWDANRVPIAQLKSLGFNFNIALDTLKETTDELLTTVGTTAATVDLSLFPIVPPDNINPGTVSLSFVSDTIGDVVVLDDSDGGFPVSQVLPLGGTIDYVTGDLTGVTSLLGAASTVTASYLFSQKDPALQRAEVLNAIQFFLNKGIDQGYVIAAGLSGLLVTITPLWAETCDPGASLQVAGPTEFFPRFDAFPADLIPTDLTFDDFFARWPQRLDSENPCRSSFLDLFFFSPDDTEIENFSVVAEDVINNLERVRPIHVRFRSITFDGPRVAGGGWTIPVVAENAASGGGWTIPVTAELRSSGGGWTIPVVATPTP